MKNLIVFTTLLSMLCLTTPASAVAKGMQDDVDQAVNIFQRFQKMPEKGIPKEVLKDAKGLAILTIIKAGFVVSGRVGKGVMVVRTANGWSAPSAIGTGGAGFGLQIGGKVSEFVIILNTEEAVKAFSKEGNVELGAGISVAAGPVGRTAEAGITPMAAIYTYSRSQGLFAGISLEGTVLTTRTDVNTAYYGQAVLPADIFAGKVKAPAGVKKLQNVLKKY